MGDAGRGPVLPLIVSATIILGRYAGWEPVETARYYGRGRKRSAPVRAASREDELVAAL